MTPIEILIIVCVLGLIVITVSGSLNTSDSNKLSSPSYSCTTFHVPIYDQGDGSYAIGRPGDLLLEIINPNEQGDGKILSNGQIIGTVKDLPLATGGNNSYLYVPVLPIGDVKPMGIFGIVDAYYRKKIRDSGQILRVDGYC